MVPRGLSPLPCPRELSDQEALAFNPWNLLRATPTGPADDWDPAGVRARYEGLGQGSLVYRMAITGASPNIITGRAGATIGATVSPARAAQTITWSTASNLVSLSNTEGPSTMVTGRNTTGTAQYVPVKATAANGFYATAWVYVQPAYIDPPVLTSGAGFERFPKMNGTVTLSYRLNKTAARTDQSIVTWASCEEPSCASPRTVAVSRGDVPLTVYLLTPGDVGRYLRATIQPKFDISDPGPAVAVTAATPTPKSALASGVVSPNFMNFVTDDNNSYVSGYWTVLGSWTSVSGSAFVNGYGVRAASAGSALLYQQDAPHRGRYCGSRSSCLPKRQKDETPGTRLGGGCQHSERGHIHQVRSAHADRIFVALVADHAVGPQVYVPVISTHTHTAWVRLSARRKS